MIRNSHLFQGKLKKEVFDANSSIEAFREQCEKGGSKVKIPEGVEINAENINGIRSEWIVPDGANSQDVIFYVHGP